MNAENAASSMRWRAVGSLAPSWGCFDVDLAVTRFFLDLVPFGTVAFIHRYQQVPVIDIVDTT
jgi:hypothetical protein